MLGTAGFEKVVNSVQLYNGNRSIFHAVKVDDDKFAEMDAEDWENRHGWSARSIFRCRGLSWTGPGASCYRSVVRLLLSPTPGVTGVANELECMSVPVLPGAQG